jgi:transposase InsO family protein
VAESFFATLEHELLAHTVRHSHHEANVSLTDFIEHGYNREQQHSTLGYVSPQQDEHQHRQMARAA